MKTVWVIVGLTLCKCLAPSYIITLRNSQGKKITLEVGDAEYNTGVLKKGDRVYLLPDSSVVHNKDTFYFYNNNNDQ